MARRDVMDIGTFHCENTKKSLCIETNRFT